MTSSIRSRVCSSAALIVILLWGSASAQQGPALVRFTTDNFWVNLHHFLYVLGRAENKAPDSGRRAVAGAPADESRGLEQLNDTERKIWRTSVNAYAAGASKLDAVFDQPLVDADVALAGVGSATEPPGRGLDAAVRDALVRAAPLYRKAWWPAHQAANREWLKIVQPLVDQHGPAAVAFVSDRYKLIWPAGIPVHVSAYANWAGAFSVTRAKFILISSLDTGNAGPYAFESVIHETMHQWDDEIDRRLAAAAKPLGKPVPGALSHAMVFYTAGEAVKRALPTHVPYAEINGLWKQKGLGAFKAALDAGWAPYLADKVSLEEALRVVLGGS